MTQVVPALKDIIKQQLTGRLTVTDPNDPTIHWQAYFGKGKIHYASCNTGQRERLNYLLHRYYPTLKLGELSVGQSDYQFICHQWQAGKITLQEVRQLAFTSTQEACVQILTIGDAQMDFQIDATLEPLILAVSLPQVVSPVKKTISFWQQVHPHLPSPLSRLYLSNVDALYKLLWQRLQSTKAIEHYQTALTQNLCLYSIADRLNLDALQISSLLIPLIESKDVKITKYGQNQYEDRVLIACVDDSRTVQNSVKIALEAQGYEVISLLEPGRAMTKLIRSRPKAILMDITMPEINGYELCQLLRKSAALKNIPIIMLTSKDNLFDRMKAKMVGADDYITKPFTTSQLLNTVNKHVSQVLVKAS
jgi:twitching motility two-component system response regulator PilG